MKLDYRRLLNTKDLEVYMVRKERFSFEEIGFILLVDLKRPSKLADIPILVGVIDDDDFDSSANHIAGYVISKVKINMNDFQDISYFVECLLDNNSNCSHYLHEIVEDYENTNFNSEISIVEFVKPYLKRLNLNIDISKITNSSFNHLTQY
jgi:hypothetical protein